MQNIDLNLVQKLIKVLFHSGPDKCFVNHAVTVQTETIKL